MIKINKRVNLIALILFIFLIKPVFSQEDYSIENLRMYITVDDKGDAHVIEKITYKFHSKSNGVTKSLYLEDNSKIDNLKAYEIYPNKKQLQLELFDHNNNLDFRVYDKSNIETKIYKIEYDLEDFIIKYIGFDEFKFKIFNAHNEIAIKKINISIHFSENKMYGNIKAFQHGYLYKNVKVEKNEVSYSIDKFPPNIELELEILLAKDIPTYKVQSNTEYTSYEQLLNEEINIETKYKNILDKIKKINIASISILILDVVYIIFLFSTIYFFQKGNLPRSYNLKLPKDYSPAIMSCILKYKKITSKDFFVTIFDLIRKGYLLEIDTETIENYKLKLTNKDTSGLKKHEKYLLNWLFRFTQNDNIICLKDIKKYNQDEKKFFEFKRFYNTWKRKVYKECEDYGYLKRNTHTKSLLYLYSCLKILLGILLIYKYSPYLYIVSICLIISGVVNNIYLFKSKLTRLGYKERKKWINFKKFIIHFKNPKILNSDNIKIWEAYIIYSISLEIQKELLYKFRNNKEIRNLMYFNKASDKTFIQLINTALRANELDPVLRVKKNNK